MTEQEEIAQPVFRDALFRQKRKHGKYRVVDAPVLEASVADTHAHLQLLDDPALALARCAVHGVGFVCTIADVYEDGATTFEELGTWLHEAAFVLSEIAPETAECAADNPPALPHATKCADSRPELPHVRIISGCHPHHAQYYNDELEAALVRCLRDPRVAAIGEVGLDFHYDYSPRDDQREAFRRQLRLAHKVGLPVVLHVREAHDEALAILDEEGFPEAGTLLHCFNLDAETLAPWLDRGCYVAFGGPLTFKKADEVRVAAAGVPLDRLLTETDAPFMTPEPLRGMTCGPEHVIFTAARMAEVRGQAPGEQRRAFLEELQANAHRLLDRRPLAWQTKKGKDSIS